MAGWSDMCDIAQLHGAPAAQVHRQIGATLLTMAGGANPDQQFHLFWHIVPLLPDAGYSSLGSGWGL